MSDSFTETTSKSWFGRVAGSIIGVPIGLLLVVGMVVLLFWNEGRAVQTARSLDEGAGAVVAVTGVDPANEGRLVHATGKVTSDETLRDGDFGISARAVSLIRRAEMYQWIEDQKSETRTKLGGGEETVTTYSYRKDWADDAVDSSRFKKPDGHANPSMRWTDRTFALDAATMGPWQLDRRTLSRMGGATEVPVEATQEAAIRQAFGRGDLSVSGGRIYLGENPSRPQIGDQRIRYEIEPLGEISVVARQAGSGFADYQTKAGDALFMVARGTVPADAMFAEARSDNAVLTWILRAVGLVVMAIGFAMVMGPLGVLADVIPFLGTIMRAGTGLLAVALAVLVGSIVIAIAWFWYRPLLAIAILAAGALVVWAIGRLARGRTAASATA